MDLYKILERAIKCEREAEWTETRHQRQCQCHSLFVLVNTRTHTHTETVRTSCYAFWIFMKNSQPPCHLAWPICDTDRQTDICMYKQLTSPLQAGCRYSSLYVSPYRLCWFRLQLLENRMHIIIQHDPQTYTYVCKVMPSPCQSP